MLVDGNTYERSIITMPDTTITVVSMGFEYTLIPNETMLAEGNMYGNSLNDNAYDGLDNDLDGLIDENYQIHYRQYLESTEGIVLLDLTNPVCYKDYVTGYGLDDPMIDESRQDLIDNDNDWDPERDDVGADGKADTYDYGEGDGVPTTGEPHFDRTDVDESDQIGLTSFDYFVPSTDIDRGNENEMWGRLFPGRFEVPESVIGNRPARGEDGDFIFGSGYFPLFPGDVQSFSMALVFGSDLEALKRSKGIAQMIYDSNYNFPRPPERPTLTAVAGDGRVTLYWDRIAEDSYDESLQEYDFEGYKIYKGTDPAFSDAKTISNGFGDMVDYDPEEQFDLENQITGFFNADPILSDKVGGRPYYLGDDSGIQNYFVDENVINGKTYYYAVCAYDHGNEKESVFPSENSKSIYVDAAGKPYPEQNCAVVVPNPPVSGYLPPQSDMLMNHDAGFSTHIPFVEVVDPARVKDVTYRITFVDSMVEDVQLARGYTLINMTDNDTLCKNNSNILPWNGDVFDGLRFSFNTKYQDLANVKLDTLRSGWNNTNGDNLEIIASSKFNYKDFEITRCPYDYLFVFSDSIVTKSSILSSIFGVPSPFKEIDTNFKIYNVTDPDHPVEVQYGFVDALTGEKNRLSHFDGVYLSNPDGTVLSWKIVLSGQEAPVPAAGDSLLLSFYKPFNSNDEFSYMSKASQSDLNLSKNEMDEIRVVPNPYVITNLFEKPLPSQMTGRGERIVNFINLPNKCTIKIFSSSGSHIRTLEHEGGLENGTCSWNLRSKEGLDVAFGVYFYVVEAGEFNDKKMGKLAIIK